MNDGSDYSRSSSPFPLRADKICILDVHAALSARPEGPLRDLFSLNSKERAALLPLEV